MTDKPLTVGSVAELVGGTVEGDASVELSSIASLEAASASELTFAADARHAARLAECGAGAAIVTKGQEVEAAAMPLIRVNDVHAALATLLGYLSPPADLPPVGVAASAVVSPQAELGQDVRIAPGVAIGPRAKIGRGSALCANVYVGADVELGQDVLLWEGVVVRQSCKIGDRVQIGSNSVIGYDGFGYYQADGMHHKIPHIGNVVIEDDVEIGACSCVDRAKFGSTRIGRGTKIDNLVQVAHNVQIGRGCLLAAQCGIAGSTKLGDYVVLGGGAGVRDNITLGNGVTCAAYAAIAGDVPDGQTVAGIPADPVSEKLRQWQAMRKLPDLLKRVRRIESRLNDRESSKDH